MKKKKERNNFEENLSRLKNIVEELEAKLPIEKAIELYEEGIKLSSSLEIQLGDIENRIYQAKNIKNIQENSQNEDAADQKIEFELFE